MALNYHYLSDIIASSNKNCRAHLVEFLFLFILLEDEILEKVTLVGCWDLKLIFKRVSLHKAFLENIILVHLPLKILLVKRKVLMNSKVALKSQKKNKKKIDFSKMPNYYLIDKILSFYCSSINNMWPW